jgi:hypothetical protein
MDLEGCKRDGCPGTGVWVPVLLLRTKRTEDAVRARLPDVQQCEMHKDQSKLEDFLSPEGWDKIQRHLRQAGKGRFSQRLTALAWDPVPGGGAECLPF